MHPAALCLVPHPAGPSPSRAICARVLEEAVRQAPAAVNTLVVRLVGTQDAGVGGGSGSGDCGDAASGARIPEWRSRAEEIALYNEIHSLAMQHDRLTLDMVVMPFYAPESAETDGSKSAGTTLPPSLRAVTAYGLTAFANLVPKGTPFTALDTHEAVAPFLDDKDFFTYEDESRDLPTYNLVAMGGTFDNLHAGHKRLLAAASRVCTGTLTVGVTSDLYLAKEEKFGNMIESLDTRLRACENFFRVLIQNCA